MDEFAKKIDLAVAQKAADLVLEAFDPHGRNAPKAPRARRKSPVQLCPVPRCRNAAAPVYSMVCGAHKDVPKAKIKQYREARRKRVSAGRRA